MLQYLKTSGVVALGLLRTINEAIDMFEVPGHGPEKKRAVLSVGMTLYNTISKTLPGGAPLATDTVATLVSSLIDVVVGFRNAVGKWGDAGTEPSPVSIPDEPDIPPSEFTPSMFVGK